MYFSFHVFTYIFGWVTNFYFNNKLRLGLESGLYLEQGLKKSFEGFISPDCELNINLSRTESILYAIYIVMGTGVVL